MPVRVKVIRPPAFSPAAIVNGISELRSYTDLLYTLSIHRIKVRYKQSVLGLAWAVLQPLALMLIYTIIFSVLTRVPTNGIPYPVFVYSALLPWTFFSTAISNSAVGLVNHTQLITKVYFPREIIPLTYILAALFDLMVASVILAAMMLYYRIPLTPLSLLAIPLIGVAFAFTTGLGLVFSALQVRFRDIGLAMPLLLQLWTYATPVVYPLSSVPARLRPVYDLNPMVGVVENFRRVVLSGTAPDLPSLFRGLFASLILLGFGYIVFKKREATMADII